MRSECNVGEENIGRMSSKRIPGLGKSGYWRSERRRFSVRLESSVGRVEVAEGCPGRWAVTAVTSRVEGGEFGEADCEGVVMSERRRQFKVVEKASNSNIETMSDKN